MGMTLAEKIIAKAAGRPAVVPGEIVTCAVDLAMINDSNCACRLSRLLSTLRASRRGFFEHALPKRAPECFLATQSRAQTGAAIGAIRLVSRFRSSQTFAAPSDANFGIKGTLATL